MSVFVDANCFKSYIDALIADTRNNCRNAVETIVETSHISLDSGGIFEQEWRACTGGYGNIFVGDHIAELMERGKIVLADFVRDNGLKRKLSQMGIPAKDVRIIEFSSGAEVKLISSNDIDLYEPSQKGCNSKMHTKLVHNRGGSVCKFLEKKIGLVVCCCCRVPELLA